MTSTGPTGWVISKGFIPYEAGIKPGTRATAPCNTIHWIKKTSAARTFLDSSRKTISGDGFIKIFPETIL